MMIMARDVTDPAQAAKPLLTFKSFQTNTDGSTVIVVDDGTFAYQEPNQYGLFKLTPNPIGAYQSCKVAGQLVSFHAIPPGDPNAPPYVYTWMELPN